MVQVSADALLGEYERQRSSCGAGDFYVPLRVLVLLARRACESSTRPRMSLNRPHSDGKRMVHWVELGGLRFTSVSLCPVMLAY